MSTQEFNGFEGVCRARSGTQFRGASLLLAGTLTGMVALAPASFAQIGLQQIGRYATGIFAEGASEITAHDPGSQRLFVVNGAEQSIDVLDISDPTMPTLVSQWSMTPYGKTANSVAAYGGYVAAAVEAAVKTDPGSVVFFEAATGNVVATVEVGALPDMLTFTPDGNWVLVANEGEPNDDYSIDPEGSVSVIDVSGGIPNLTQGDVRTAGFTAYNNAPLDPSVRVFGPNATVAQDFEPEYIAVDGESKLAWVTLQENNAVARISIQRAEVTAVFGLGAKNHAAPNAGLDASDRDDAINIRRWPVYGMYQPDAIAFFFVNNRPYLITANEGDARDYDTFAEEVRVADLNLDPVAFPKADILKREDVLGRLTVTNTVGDEGNDGDFEALYAFGGRSFSIWSADLRLISDSGDRLERITASLYPDDFNSTNDENGTFDNRSDNKGPEPEGIAIFKARGRVFAFIGLERIGGVLIADVSTPYKPVFVDYVNNRDFSGDPELGTAGDLGPEGLLVINGEDSPNGEPLLVVSNEVSGSTTIFQIVQQ